MHSWRIGWRRAGLLAGVLGLLSSCLLTANFDGLTGGLVPSDAGPDAATASTSSGSSSGSGGAASSASASSGSGMGSSSSSSSASSSSSSGLFPSKPVLDNFDRANGALAGMWLIENPGVYTILGDKLAVPTGDPGVLIWPTVFGPDQEAFITIGSIDSADSEHELILKNQGGVQECESLQIDYVYPTLHAVRCTAGKYDEIETGIDVMFAPGDQLGARAHANGIVEAFKNGVLLKSWDATAWAPYYSMGGRIGWASWGTKKPALLDNYGGG